MVDKLVFGYWSIRGLGQPIRYLLKYVNAEYIERTYHFGPAPDFNRNEWLLDKFSLGLAFPNLPYLIHGDIKLTQSKAVLRYLGKVFALDGRNVKEQVRIDQAEQQTVDLRSVLRQICFFEPTNFDQLLAAQLPVLEQFDAFVCPDAWVLPDRITYVDFFLFETLDLLLSINPHSLEAFPALTSYHRRFSAIPAISSYRDSDEFRQMSFFYGPSKMFATSHLK